MNHAIAVTEIDLDAVTGFMNNTASGNASNYMLITNGGLGASATITPANVLGGALVSTSITIPTGASLTLQPGVVIKFRDSFDQLNVSGTFDVNGTSGSPVVITSLEDDSAGGDTNGDGSSSTPAAGDWRGLAFNTNSDASALDWCQVRYTGSSGFASLRLNMADITVTNCTLGDGADDGIEVNSNSFCP